MPIIPGCETAKPSRVVVAVATVRTNAREHGEATAGLHVSGSAVGSSVVASDRKARRPPSSLMLGEYDSRSLCTPAVETLNRVVVDVSTSRRKMSLTWLVSPATRFVAIDSKTT